MQVARQSLTDQIVDVLRRRIVSGELAEGTKLRQEKLAAELGVSRVPLREAIRQLEGEGLVTTELHKGTVVSSLSPHEVEELFEMRMQLEPWLFGLAIPAMSETDFQAAHEVIAEASAVTDAREWGELNWRFHHALCVASGRHLALRLLRTVHDNANRYVNLKLAVAVDVDRELEDHRRLIAFARLRDVDGGVALLREHIHSVAESLTTWIGHRTSVSDVA